MNQDNVPKGPPIGMRHCQTLLIFFNIVVVYISRLNVGIAVVAMTNAATTNPKFPNFNWTTKQQSFIISSFYWGYIFTQFLGGYLGRHFGSKITMFTATFGNGILSLITPVSVNWGSWQVFCGIRVVQGLFQGMIFPNIHAHLAKWSPVQERNRLGACAHTGIECGTVSAFFISGMIAQSAIGWPGISYMAGGLCLLWCVAWMIFASNNAPESRCITEAEKNYIESSMLRSDDFHNVKIPIPWRAILSSCPFWSLLCARCAESWGISTMNSQIPSYLNGVLNMPMKRNAFFSALPFLTMWIFSYIYLACADIMLRKKVKLTCIRKTFNSIALWIPSIALIWIGFLGPSQTTLAICLMTLSVGVNSGATIGSTLNTIDLSPNHAGILMGIINTVSNCIPILTPLVVGFIVTNKSRRTQWQIVFAIAAVIFFVGNLVYVIFGTAVSQPWDDPDYISKRDAEKEKKTKEAK